ncbi:hypothetical protein SAMN05444161_2646 [Rhizobiales bacterium GAS191]|nr:hypothetical protein SAMN05519103_01757 [Rhizobiales bacterium GAS113]SEC06335.1 hypothetical protein SAMN05519104_0671 [Rhizobiales bacterium GAS188]SED16063.1 hypothetical protein SAMN05444161_2646 [Rhizobiales bacterium GAS191]
MVLCAALVAAWLSTSAKGQEAVQVAPFDVVAMLLHVLLAEKACKNFVVDQGAFKRYLADHGIEAAQLSRTGPYGAEVVQTRRKLRTAFARHNKETCDLSFAMFGPNGAAIPGLVIAR